MCDNNAFSSVDKHWIPIPIWQRWSCRVPLCGLKVRVSFILCFKSEIPFDHYYEIAPNLGLEVPICNNIYTHDSKKYFILYREFAPTSGSGISEPKPTDRAKVEHQSINLTIYLYYQNISQWFSYLFRYCRILAAGCKLLPLETRKCLHCNQPMCWLLCVRQS